MSAAHISGMEITGYMNLTPQDIIFDHATRAAALGPDARGCLGEVYPDAETAEFSRVKGAATYAVTAEVANGSVFEVRADIDRTEGKLGTYVAGLFSNYSAAFEAAGGLGVYGRRGMITVMPEPLQVFDSIADWQAQRPTAQMVKRAGTDLRQLVNLRAGDAAALEAADPEYALFLKLREKFAPQDGATA